MHTKLKNRLARWGGAVVAAMLMLALVTAFSIQPVRESLPAIASHADHAAITDRAGRPLNISLQNRWNSFDYVPLHEMPEFLRQAFVLSEDRHFFDHAGVDWRALAASAWQDARHFSALRGGSTITEQVVRILHARPRTLWSKWIEIWEAQRLEDSATKEQILEFYCNELPYAANRRGVAQAASYYFNRDLQTLSQKEMLALVVLARAPSSYDLYRNPDKINAAISRLAEQMQAAGYMSAQDVTAQVNEPLAVEPRSTIGGVEHFVDFIRHQPDEGENGPLRTTLDLSLQRGVRDILVQRLKALAKMNVHNAAAMVIDHRSGEILAWVVAGGDSESGAVNPTSAINAVLVPRQPGSSMKPFLYAAALDSGWTAATLIDDSPMAESIGSGLHEFKNYSRSFYGKITLREALANSLNIPALRTIGFVGVEHYLDILHQLGFESLSRDADTYREGLALGNGEVTLYEMVHGYAALANRGMARALRYRLESASRDETRIYSAEAASLIGNILSDPWARRLEFGYGSVLNLPIQTAVKTGTSTDYRDAWTMGYDSRYVVGIWMGNLDRTPMDGVTGAVGPALALHSIFSLLNQDMDTHSLYLSPRLIQKQICVHTDVDGAAPCRYRSEYFAPGAEDVEQKKQSPPTLTLERPTQGLQMAYDPRVPADKQVFNFKIGHFGEVCSPPCNVIWQLNDEVIARTTSATYPWHLRRGKFTLQAKVTRGDETVFSSGAIHFVVK